MGALSRQFESPFAMADWEPGVTQRLDEHHLVAWSDRPDRCLHFAASLARFLESQRDTEVCHLYGRHIRDLESFCYQLERTVTGGRLERRIDGTNGVTALLRHRHSFPGRPASKFRFVIWHDADVLQQADPDLFARLADALAGVAAELEYVSDDLLLIQRAVLVGGRGLWRTAADPQGPFQQWYDDGCGEPFWRVVTSIEQPAFDPFPIDTLG